MNEIIKTEKRKLLITTDAFLPKWDGIARFLLEIIPRLQDEYDVTIIAPRFEGKTPYIEGVKIYLMPLIKIQVADSYPAFPKFGLFKKLIKESDIIFNQTLGPIGMTAIKYAKRYKKPVISYMHIIEWETVPKSVKRGKWFAKFLALIFTRHYYNRCNLLMVPTKEEAELLNLNDIRTMKAVIYLGTNTKKFSPPEDKDEAKKAIGINPKYTVIGFVGRLSREKNLITLYRAFKNLYKENNNVRLLVVGKGIKEQEDIVKGKPGVIFAGSQDDVAPYYKAMDIYVLASLSETTSLTTLEAMSAGLAVLATKVGFVKEYIKNNKNGMFFPKNNPYILRKKLEMLVSNVDLRNELGKNARQTVEAKFRWDVTVKKIKKVLEAF